LTKRTWAAKWKNWPKKKKGKNHDSSGKKDTAARDQRGEKGNGQPPPPPPLGKSPIGRTLKTERNTQQGAAGFNHGGEQGKGET